MLPGPRVLVVRFSSLGDVVLITPLLRAVRRRHPHAQITVLSQWRYAELLEGNPAVTRIVAAGPREPLDDLARRLAPEDYEVRIDLQDSWRSRRLRRRLGGVWGVLDRGRTRRQLLVWLGKARRPFRSVVDAYFGAAGALEVSPDGEPAEVFPTREDQERAAALVPAGCVALAPGGSRASKRWPPSHWRALAARLAAAGQTVLAVGGAEERPLLSGPGLIEAYGWPLRATAALLGRARLVVANDSGLMHLATAVRRPVIALLGPTVAALGYAPYGVPAQVLERPLACRPCSAIGSDHCPLGHHRCMIDITPDTVAAAVERAA